MKNFKINLKYISKYQKTLFIFFSLTLFLSLGHTNQTTPPSLNKNYLFSPPDLTEEEELEARSANESEALEVNALYKELQKEAQSNKTPDLIFQPVSKTYDQVQIDIYQNSPYFKKQFLVAKVNGRIRYAFHISTGTDKYPTPAGRNMNIQYQVWRNDSNLYPTSKYVDKNGKPLENNLDHISFFAESIGFHATNFYNYDKLGRADSHGCARLARPQARAIYALIRGNKNDGVNISDIVYYSLLINSFKNNEDPPLEEREIIKNLLDIDFNFTQALINNKIRGDVPFMKQRDYFDFRDNKISDVDLQKYLDSFNKGKSGIYPIKEIIEIPDIMDRSRHPDYDTILQAT